MSFTSVPTSYADPMAGEVVADITGAGQITVINQDDTAADLWTATVSSTGPTSVVYTDPDGVSSTITIAASATGAALEIAIEGHPDEIITRDYDLVATSSTTMTATAKDQSRVGSFTNSTNLSWAHTTTGSLGADLPLGRAVIRSGVGSNPGAGRVEVKACDSLTAAIVITDTMTGTVNTGDELATVIDFPALRLSVGPVKTIYAASEAATLTAHAAAINAAIDAAQGMLDGASITAARSGSTITYTGDEKGLTLRVRSVVTNTASGSGVLTTTYTTPSSDPNGNIAYDLHAAFAGIVCRAAAIVNDSSSPPVAVLPRGKAGRIFRGPGKISVPVAAGTPAIGGRVYVGTSPSTAGKLAATPTDGYVPLSLDLAEWGGSASNSYALLTLKRSF